MDKATVTGCSGFIGSHLCRHLKGEGYYVIGCDIKPTPVPGFEPDEFYSVDLRNADEALLFFDKAGGTLFALAADMGGIGYITQEKLDYDILHNNLLINLNTAECFRGMPDKYSGLFFSSSACVYPQYLQDDVDKPHDLAETDTYPAYPDSEYGWEKLVAEHLYDAVGRNFDRKVRIARFHNIYGPCFDDQTEILTIDGWRQFEELRYNDLVATLNADHVVEYHRPEAIQRHLHNGEMYQAQHRYVDMMVTPDHQLYYGKAAGQEFKLGKVKDIWSGELIVPTAAVWGGDERKWFVLPEARHTDGRLHYKNKQRRMDMDLWLAFLGWYLSEGCCFQTPRNYVVCITQYDDESRHEIMELINEMGFSCHDNGPNIIITSKQLYNYCVRFGHAPDKYIPREFLELPPRQLGILCNTLMAGDGDKARRRYSTTSSQLADDFQELALKQGWSACIRQEAARESGHSDMYRVYFRHESAAYLRPRNRSVVTYQGWVYDVTVPNHVILVRRNGKAWWSGNCGDYQTERAKAPAALSRKVARAKLAGDPHIQLWGDGKQVRSFCYIDDCLTGIMALMESDANFPIPVNIGSDEAITIRGLVEMISSIAGYGIVVGLDLNAPQGVRYRNADLRYVKKILGWQPKISLREGMERTYKWIEKQVALDLLEERRQVENG